MPWFKFCWLQIFLWITFSWNSCSMWDKTEWLNWFWQFLCGSVSFFNLKDSSTHMHGLTGYAKERLPFARSLSLENSVDSYLCFGLALLCSISYFFFLYPSSYSTLWTIFDSILSNTDEVLSVNPSSNLFAFAEFNVLHKYLGKSVPLFWEFFWKFNQ